MKKLNNKGYMLVEIILAFVIMFGLIYFLMDLVINLKNKNDDLVVDTIVKTDQTIISNKLMEHIIKDTSDVENIKFNCDSIDVEGHTIKYNDNIVAIVDDSASIIYEKGNEKYCYNKNGRIHINIPVEIKQMSDKNYDIVVDYRYKLMHCNPLKSYSCSNASVGSEPYTFTYTGKCIVEQDGGNNDWKIKFTTSGTFTSECEMLLDVFLVGGGGGGGGGHYVAGGGGGGGGYTNTSIVKISAGKKYEIKVGAGGNGGKGGNTSGDNNYGGGSGKTGETTTAFGLLAFGGDGGIGTSGGAGGNGGSGGSGGGGGAGCYENGGKGGTDGGNGISGNGGARYGMGQSVTTREFGVETATKYAGGGGGGGGRCGDASANHWDDSGNGGAGGAGGGASGTKKGVGSAAIANTGGGGGGGGATGQYGGAAGGKGGSGIAIIRNARTVKELSINFEYLDGSYVYTDDGAGNWQLKFLTSGTFVPKENMSIDVFLVGGGGGGGGGHYQSGGGGGGGGKTLTKKMISLTANTEYKITIGTGGSAGTPTSKGGKGGTTSAFDKSATGGSGGGPVNGSPTGIGGSGGSGGGGGGGYDGTGGKGGSNGNNGGNGYYTAGTGQLASTGINTREFGENTGFLYSGGGGGGIGHPSEDNHGGLGGTGGGGSGGNSSKGTKGMVNSGGGGGGGSPGNNGGSGGSGIVIIRKAK